MNYTIHKISLDIHDIGAQSCVALRQGDTHHKIIATLTESGEPYTISGCTAKFSAKKPDSNYIYNDCVIDTEKNTITYTITPQTTAASGEVECQIILLGSDGGILATPEFCLVVTDKVYNEQEIVNSSTEYNSLSTYLSNLEQDVADGVFNLHSSMDRFKLLIFRQ